MNSYGQIIGMTTTDEVILLNQQSKPVPYELQDIFVLEDETGDIYPVEVTKSIAFGEFESETIQGIIMGESTMHLSNIDKNKPVYVGWATSLKDLTTPIPPNAKVRPAKFEEVEEYIIHADVDNSFHIGTIKGTENMQKELPKELSDISPMWDDDKNTVVPQNGVPFMFDYTSLREYPHVGLFGSSGSGKSFGMHSIIEEFMKKRIPGIYLDPHNEGVFRKAMAGLPGHHKKNFLGSYDVFKVGVNIGIPFSELNVGDLYYLLEFVGGISDAQKAALDAVYERGDTFSHLINKFELLKVAFDYYDTPQWKRDIEEDEFRRVNLDEALLYDTVKNRVANVSVVDAIIWRLLSLESRNVFDEKNGINGVVSSIKSGRFAIIQGGIGKLQMLSSYLIRKLYDSRRMYVDSKDQAISRHDYFPPFIISGDEFQNFAPNTQFTNPTGRVIREIAKEARKYGVYLIASTQQTSAIDPAVFAQLNTKFIYRLNSMEDIELTSREASLTEEQTKQLPKLHQGHAFVINPKIPRTMLVKFRTTLTESSTVDDPFAELREQFQDTDTELGDVLERLLTLQKEYHITEIPGVVVKTLSDELNRDVEYKDVIEAFNVMIGNGIAKFEKGTYIKI